MWLLEDNLPAIVVVVYAKQIMALGEEKTPTAFFPSLHLPFIGASGWRSQTPLVCFPLVFPSLFLPTFLYPALCLPSAFQEVFRLFLQVCSLIFVSQRWDPHLNPVRSRQLRALAMCSAEVLMSLTLGPR